MPQPVFISYARKASREHAEALHRELGADLAFLDTEDIRYGEPFPERLLNALLDSRVVVILAEPIYFTRWYCLLEYRLARRPYLRLLESAGATNAERNDALRGIVLAMPPGDTDPILDRFPPFVQGQNWAPVDQPAEIAALVRERLAANPPTFRERYEGIGELDRIRDLVRETTQLPYPRRVGNIPAVPLDLPQSIRERFVGRANDIWRIHDVLTTERGGPSAASLTGAIEAGGGFGKTRLALEYLYRFGTRHFRGGLFWINAEQDLEDQFYAIVKELDPSAPEVAALRERQGGVAGVLVRLVRARPDAALPPLFVIDNVPEPESGKAPLHLSHWCPVLGEAAVLTTSRRRLSLTGDIVSISLHPLETDAAVRLLTGGGAHAHLSAKEAAEVAEGVGNLPLALELLNGLLTSSAMSGRELLELSREERPAAALDEAMEVLRGTVPEGTLRGVTEAFAASYERLSEQEQLAARLIAWMAPAVVPNVVMEALQQVFPRAIRATLRSRHLVTAPEHTTASADDSLFGSMHRVLADFLRSRSTDPCEEQRLLTAGFQRLSETGTADEQLKAMRLMGPAFATFAKNALDAAGEISAVFGQISLLASRLRDAGVHAWAQDAQARVVSARRRLQGDEHHDTLAAMHNLAFAYSSRGDYQAAQALQEQTLAVTRRILGEEHPDTLAVMNNLSEILCERGDAAGAQDLQETVLSVRTRIWGEDHPDTLVSLNNLAFIMWIRGDGIGAQELQEQVLSARLRILGDEHPDTLTAMNNLALTLWERGKEARAQELHERTLSARRRILGEDHPDTLTTLNNVATIVGALGDHALAQDLEERVLAVRRHTVGDEHPDTLTSMNNLAETLRMRGDHARAKELQEVVLKARQRILGDDHPDTVTTMGNLALTLLQLGDFAAGQELYERVLPAYRLIYGERAPKTSVAAWFLHRASIACGDLPRAATVLQELAWLTGADPQTLNTAQCQIREWLLELARLLQERA